MRIGVDLGGTKTEAVVMDDGGAVLQRQRAPTPTRAGYEAIVRTVAQLVRDLETRAGVDCSVGVGTPGAVSRISGAMKNCNTSCLNGRPLRDDLCRVLDREVRTANDANCFALSEAIDGAARSAGVAFGIILGTGVGGGVVLGQRVHDGPNEIAGEWGHIPLIPDGPACYCGHSGCVETVLSGPGLLEDYQRGGGSTAHSAASVAQAARRGDDRHALAAMDRYLRRFGRAVATVINILDPDIIVLGGGLSAIDRLYSDGPAAVRPHVFNDELRTPIVRNQHGDSSGVRGAAMLWPARRRSHQRT